MYVENMIEKAVNGLTRNKEFQIRCINYDEQNFGNIKVILSANGEMDICFVKEKGVFWCEIGQGGQWFFIEDICDFMGITFANGSSDFIDYIRKVANLIEANEWRIFEVLRSKYAKTRMKEIATHRTIKMFR